MKVALFNPSFLTRFEIKQTELRHSKIVTWRLRQLFVTLGFLKAVFRYIWGFGIKLCQQPYQVVGTRRTVTVFFFQLALANTIDTTWKRTLKLYLV